MTELSAGGIAKEINASNVDQFLAEVRPTTPAQHVRHDLAVELLGDFRCGCRVDAGVCARRGCCALRGC
jgi:hypothetical protein